MYWAFSICMVTFKEARKHHLLGEFLSDSSEVHACYFGFYSAWFKLRREVLSAELKEQIKREYHYFSFGFFVGRLLHVAALLGIGSKIVGLL